MEQELKNKVTKYYVIFSETRGGYWNRVTKKIRALEHATFFEKGSYENIERYVMNDPDLNERLGSYSIKWHPTTHIGFPNRIDLNPHGMVLLFLCFYIQQYNNTQTSMAHLKCIQWPILQHWRLQES